MILKRYGFHNVKTSPIHRGTDSYAVLVQHGEDKFILRRLRNQLQADMEYGISSALKGKSIVPEILLTEDGQHYVLKDGILYNLQEYVEGTAVSQLDEDLLKTLARQIALMHKSLSTCPLKESGEDRFSLKQAMRQCENKKETLLAVLNQKDIDPVEFEKWCKELVVFDEQKFQLIHGDLGFWNMIQSGKKIYFIDFGECRMGSIYFDVAAVMASILSKSQMDTFLPNVYDPFIKEYAAHNSPLDSKELYYYLMLWYVRGIYAVMLNEKDKRIQKFAIVYFLQEIEKCKKVLKVFY